MVMAKRFTPLILFTDSLPSSSIPGHAPQQQARHLRIPPAYEPDPSDRDRDSRRMLPPVTSLQPSSHADMDMDIDTEHSNTPRPTINLTQEKRNISNGPQALENHRDNTGISTTHTPTSEFSRQHSRHPSGTDPKSSSPISMSTTRQDRNEATSGTIVSPPSSYSSNASSSMDALAKTLSPARVDIHRKRIQRMLQQNSLLWWELVRYTRNLERSERELEQEKEQEQLSSSAGTTASTVSTKGGRALHHYHHHHHHHHHHPSLPPLHPQQQALSKSLVSSSKSSSNSRSQSRSHPYDSTVHRDHSHPTQRPKWSSSETGDYRRNDRPNSSYMDQDGDAEERTTAGASEPERERLYSKYSSASQSPSPVSTPPPAQQTFDAPSSKRYGEEPAQEESSSAFQRPRPHYPLSRRQRHEQDSRSSYSTHPSHQLDHYQRRQYDQEESRRYPSHPTAAASHTDGRYESGSATPTSTTPKRLPPVDSSRVDAASTVPLNDAHSSGLSSNASSPRSREHSSTSTVYPSHQNSQHRGQSDPRYHSSYSASHHEPHQPDHTQQRQPTLAAPFSQRRTAHSHSEFPPHHHHHHHHPPQHQHLQSPSHSHHHISHQQRPSPSPHPKIEPLPRPVPVRPAPFVSPSGTATPSPAPHSIAPSASSSGSPTQPLSAPSRTTPPTAPTVGHRHQGVDPAVAVSTSAGAQSSSNNADPNCSNNNNSNVDPNRKRRGNLPKSVTSVLKSWLVQNAIHPYPTEEEKMRLSEATQLSMNQISNWFINARRRILQPILHEAAAAAVAGTDAPVENVLIVRKGKGSRMHVEMEGVLPSSSSMSSLSSHPPAGPSSSAYSTTTAAGSAGGAGVTSTAGNNESESNSREESASLAPIKSASHSSSPQPQPHPQSQPPPQPILSA